MNNQFLFSILLPTYNSSPFLESLLKSLSMQTISDFIILTYDDNSKDGSAILFEDLCDFFKLNYKRIKSQEKNLGPKLSYQILLNETNSQFIAFCDHDDIWMPNKLQLHFDHLKGINKSAISITNAKIVDNNLEVINESLFNYFNINKNYLSDNFLISLQNKVPGICMAFNKRLKEKIIPFNKNIVMHDWWVLLISKSVNAEIKFSLKQTLLYRQHDNNTIGLRGKISGLSLKRIFNFCKKFIQQLIMVKNSKILNCIQFIFFVFRRLKLAIKNI